MRHRVAPRALQIVAGVMSCALLTGLAALYTMFLMLPPTDLAYGQGFLLTILDPFVLTVWLVFTLGSALVASPVALWSLWRVQLIKAVPLIMFVSVVAAGIGAYYYLPASPLIVLIAASLAMVWCRYHVPWQTPTSTQRGSSLESGNAT